jgi:hypothetical protein
MWYGLWNGCFWRYESALRVIFILFLAGSVLVHELRNVSAMIRKILYSRLLQVSLRHICSFSPDHSRITLSMCIFVCILCVCMCVCVCVCVSVSLSLSSRTCSRCSREVHLTAVSLAALMFFSLSFCCSLVRVFFFGVDAFRKLLFGHPWWCSNYLIRCSLLDMQKFTAV